MTVRGALDRAVLTLGVVSIVSAVFVFVRGDFQFVRMRGGGVVVALALGLLACAAGWLASRALAMVAGAGFLAAAVVLLVLLSGGGGGFLGGDASTFSLWLGLGVALVVLGRAPRPATT